MPWKGRMLFAFYSRMARTSIQDHDGLTPSPNVTVSRPLLHQAAIHVLCGDPTSGLELVLPQGSSSPLPQATRKPAPHPPRRPAKPKTFSHRRGRPGCAHRHRQENAELGREVHRNARMHPSLLIEEPRRCRQREHGLVPDVRMHIQAASPIDVERDEVLRRHVVAGQRERSDERLAVAREEELATVGMVVRMP